MSTKGFEQLLTDIWVQKRIPNATNQSIVRMKSDLGDEGFESYEAAKTFVDNEGLYLFRGLGADSIAECWNHIGGQLRYNPVDNDLELFHEVLTKENWLPIVPKDTTVALFSRCLHEVGCLIVPMKSEEDRFKIVRIPKSNWSPGGESIISDLRSLVVEHGVGTIPTVHPLREFLGKVRDFRSEMTEDQIEASVEFANDWILHIPHIAAKNDDIARAASRNISIGLAQRLIESEKPAGYRPMPQRETVMFSSADQFKIGKTATVVSIAPPELNRRVLENFTLDKEKEILRSIKGKWLVIADDLSGFTAKQGEQWKSIQTQTRPSVDDKYKNIKDFPRTDWVVATANDVFIPPNLALMARIIIVEVVSRQSSSEIEPFVRGKEIRKFFDDYRMSLFAGAITLAERGENPEAPENLWSVRREAIEESTDEQDGFTIRVKKSIKKVTTPGKPYFRLVDIAQEMGLLRHQFGERRGATIPRVSDGIPVSEDELRSAFAAFTGERGSISRRLTGVLNSLGWRNRRRRFTKGGRPIVRFSMINEHSYWPWKGE